MYLEDKKLQEEQKKMALQIEKQNSSTLTFDPITLEGLKFVGGINISFVSNEDDSEAIVSLVILEFPSLKLIYTISKVTNAVIQYKYGYLGFRECPIYLELLRDVQFNDFKPQLLLINGSGIFHPRRCGSASQISLMCDIPTIGITKKYMFMNEIKNEITGEPLKKEDIDQMWLLRNKEEKDITLKSSETNESLVIITRSHSSFERYSSKQDSKYNTNPIFISIGNKIDLPTSVRIVKACSKFRFPEPLRKSHLISRSIIRDFLF